MDRKKRCNESELKASMWDRGDVEVFECYAEGNTNTRKDAVTCLEEYSPRFQWTNTSRALDVGSGDGSVTAILTKYLPNHCKIMGSDICENVIKYARYHHSNERIEFIKFDVIDKVPEDMKEKYDHIFAMYLFHWIKDHETAFTNIYDILPKNGEFFSIFLGYSDIYCLYQILAKRKKWAPWMKNIDAFLSPYHEYEDPDIAVAKLLNKIGFKMVDVKCKQRVCVYKNIDTFKALIKGINAFDIPKHMWADFLDDVIDVKKYMNQVDEDGAVKLNYNLIVIHCVK